MGKKYVPTNDGGLLVWARNFVKKLKEKNADLKIDPRRIAELEARTQAFAAALEKAESADHSGNDITVKNERARELRKCIRDIVNEKVNYNPIVTPEFRAILRLNPRPGVRKTTRKEPSESPVLALESAKARIIARYYVRPNGRPGRPKGTRGICFKWGLLDEAPKSSADLNYTLSKTSGALTLDFEEVQRGKALYISARWENSIGEPGPWNEIQKIYIP